MSTLKACLDWKNVLSNENKRCNCYMLFLMVLSFVQFCVNAAMIAPDNSLSFLLLPASLLQIVLSFVLLGISIYICYKNKVWHFLFRLLPCALVSLILLSIVQGILGPVGLAIWVIASIYVNRHYFKPMGHYQHYTFYYFACIIISIIVGVFIIYVTMNGTSDSVMELSLFMGLIAGLSMTALLWYLLSKDIAKGKTFYEGLRTVTLLPASFMFLLIGLLTILPVKFFSGEHLFGEAGNDYLQMPEQE